MATLNINPTEDGITHINVYSKGHTDLGKSLTNFSYSPFIHTKHGAFDSVEGYWYWRSLMNTVSITELEPLRKKHGFKAKEFGKAIRKGLEEKGISIQQDDDFQEDILEAIRCKLRQNKDILSNLCKSTLPLVHYYYYGKPDNAKVQMVNEFNWQIEEIERIRSVTQNYLKQRKNKNGI